MSLARSVAESGTPGEIDVVLVWCLDLRGRFLADLVMRLENLREPRMGFGSLAEALARPLRVAVPCPGNRPSSMNSSRRSCGSKSSPGSVLA